MSSAIQNLLQKTLGDIARPTKFEAFFRLTDEESTVNPADITVQVKTASFPAKSHTPIDFKFKGRSIPIKGQTKYTQTWECTFHLTENHKLKNAFELWIEALDQKHNYPTDLNGLEMLQITHEEGYVSSIDIYQKNFDDDYSTAKYSLYNVFPIEVSPIQTNYESVGQTQEFTVTFSYSHFKMEVLKGPKGNFIDEYVGKIQDAAKSYIDQTLNDLGDSINSFVADAIGNGSNEVSDDQAGLTKNTSNSSTTNINKARESIHGGNESDMVNKLYLE